MDDAHDYLSLDPKDALLCLDRINSTIVENSNLEAMIGKLLEDLLELFSCDRVWFMYPCDPETDQIYIRDERFRPEWPGISTLGGVIPNSPSTRRFLEMCKSSESVIRFDPARNPIPQENVDALTEFHVRSMMAIPLKPNDGPNWVLGLHHCEQPVVYDRVAPLFEAISKRIAHGLSTAMMVEKLRDSENRYRALVDHAPEIITVTDQETGLFVEVNPMAAHLYGLPVEELVGRHGPLSLSPEFQPDGQASAVSGAANIERALRGKTPAFEWTHINAQGEEFPCEVVLAPFPDPSRKLVYGSVTNISDRKAAEQDRLDLEKHLARVQRLETVGQMTGGVAHDFNNLLSVVLGNLDLLSLEDDLSDAARGFIQNSINATSKGAELTRNMLSFARKAQLSPQLLQLNDIIADISKWSGRTLSAVIDLRLSLEEDLWPVMADSTSTESSVLNLIINARDAMPDGGVLTIETSNLTIGVGEDTGSNADLPIGNYVMVAVSDTGIGIPETELARIFDPFYTTKPTGEGSGLGLSMVHGFMKQSGGSVHVYSEVGTGTSFKMFFPVGKDNPTKISASKPDPINANHRPLRILVAEDQGEVMDIILRFLRAGGHDAVGASTGDIAYELFQKEGPFDLLLTDIVMPGNLQGPTLARALRKINPDLPVTFMTGYAREATLFGNGLREEDIRLMKPVSRSQLLEAVHTAVQSKPN